ncbi:MAG: hypothetical protein A3J48_03925 [Candidatus Doudnabacteria bacterium RIFCSPHIGHO2_02_FULL_46_11]|uniref:Glycosyl transferase family 1 domain-containing protein n=1 Tax=Candidatus Doudnabacteria bacterium RIFCSPHIGHO2_02_FULL_46_11 TaxID=1817832 RepID=A0A1F5P823_9BACT|nr:MAG: hypothetical protein A3J48_03925 [Candidatus Doudnabacteria bacterium RIFCSPHIGHO2_02_FULL_46_11]
MHITFLGNFFEDKGSLIFKQVVLSLGNEHKWFIFGRVADKKSFSEIKNKLSLVYPYRKKELSKMLLENKIDLVLFLSVWPETFSKTFFESVENELPIIGFNVGFPYYKFPNYSGFVDLSSGAEGIIQKINSTSASWRIAELKTEIKKIKSEFLPQAKHSAEKKYELIERLL